MKLHKKLAALSVFLLSAFTAFGQDCTDGPGLPGQDPDATGAPCPLDTWVVVLAVAALLFTVWHLYRKQSSNPIAN